MEAVARRWIARIMATWGLLSAATAFVAGPMSFYVLRFTRGIAEAGFTPGVMYFFALWFPARYRSRSSPGSGSRCRWRR